MWREVNALKEMQALQTGKAAHTGQWLPELITAFLLSHTLLSSVSLRGFVTEKYISLEPWYDTAIMVKQVLKKAFG